MTGGAGIRDDCLSEDLVEQLADGAMGFENGVAVIHGPGQVGVGEGNAAEGS
jgi:hypothetical protein